MNLLYDKNYTRMNTLKQFQQGISQIPAHIGWSLAALGEARGKQELFTRQLPQRLL